MKSKNNILFIFFSLIALVPFLLYIGKYINNFPYFDDFDAIFKFIIRYNHLDHFADKLSLIFAPHNEHRIAIVRLTSLFIYKTFGSIQLTPLCWIGNISILLTLGLLILVFLKKHITKSALLATPILFVVLNPQWFELSIWAMTFSALLIIPLAFFAIYLAVEKKWYGALIFALIATYSNGNGLFVFLILALISLLQKNKKTTLLVAATAVVVAFFYFQNIGENQQIQGAHVALGKQSLNIPYFILFGLGFLGSIFQLPNSYLLGYIVGGFIVLAWVYLTLTQYYKKNPSYYFMLLFLLLTTGVVAISRHQLGPVPAFDFRYKIYSPLTIALLYLILIDLLSERPKIQKYCFGLFLPLSIVFSAASYYMIIPKVEQRVKNNAQNLFQAKLTGKGYTDFFTLYDFDDTYKKAVTNGFFLPPKISIPYVTNSPSTVKYVQVNSTVISKIDRVFENDSLLFIQGRAKLGNQNPLKQKVFLYFKDNNSNKILLFPADYQLREKAPLFTNKNDVFAGFRLFINKKMLPFKDYTMVVDVKK